MPDTLIDGNFLMAASVGARRFEYPFRMNGDRVTALFEEDYWQTKATFTPQEMTIRHPELTDFYLMLESDPVEFMAGLYKFTRTYSRIPSQQVEYSSIWVTIPTPGAAGGSEGVFGFAAQNNPTDLQNYFNGGILTANWYYGLGTGTYYRPLKAANVISWAALGAQVVQVTGHGFANGTDMVLIEGNTNSGSPVGLLHRPSQWNVINTNYLQTIDTTNRMGLVTFAATPNGGSLGSGSRYVRCKRITDYYLPGRSPGIASPEDIPLPADESNSSVFIDALLGGVGDLNIQVGELARWRNSPIYMITKTTIDVVDLL